MPAAGSTSAVTPPTTADRSFPLTRSVASVPVWVWLVGLFGALVVMGPALGPGSLLNLDLLVLSDPPVPAGMWGLGPELPRRVPLWGPLAWLSEVFGGELVGRALLVALLVAAFAGAWRLVDRLGGRAGSGRSVGVGLGPWVAGIFYAFGPFFVTRTAVGHLLVSWVMALLPWAVTSLLAPVRSRPKALLWCGALAFGGVFGGVVAGAYLIAGLVLDRASWWGCVRRLFSTVALFLITQLPWLVPLAVVALTTGGRDLARATDFAPVLDTPADAARLVAGGGFWNEAFQIGRDLPVLSALAGIVLLSAAVYGTVRLPAGVRSASTVVAGVGFVVAVSSAVPGLSSIADAASGSAVGAPLRDTQRALVPFLLWLAVAAGLGADRLLALRPARASTGSVVAVVAVLPLAAVIVLAVPSAWGFGGQLRPVRLSAEWAEARAAIDREPGTVLSLPWFQYYSLDLARDRLTLGIAPYYFGGDVVAASDPRLTADDRVEVADPRQDRVEELIRASRAGEPVAERAAEIGVRWIVRQHDVDWQSYTGIVDDPGLELVVSGPELDLYRVRGWSGPVVDSDEAVPEVTSPVRPLLLLDGSSPAVLDRPFQAGWMRGLSSASQSEAGLVAVPAGSGPVWFWPSLLVVAADLLWLAVISRMIYSQRRAYHAERHNARIRSNQA